MARVKNTERRSGLASNPFSKVNLHGVALLDVDKIQQLCREKGKDASIHIRMRGHFIYIWFRIQMRKFTSTSLNVGLICIVDVENQAEKESKNIDVDGDQVSFSSLSKLSETPTYSQVSPLSMEEGRDASSIPVEIDCEVYTSGEGVEAPKTYYQPLPYSAAYFSRKPGMARTKQTARKTGKPAINPAKFPKGKVPPGETAGTSSGAGRGKGKFAKSLVARTRRIGRARRASDKCPVMSRKVVNPATGR